MIVQILWISNKTRNLYIIHVEPTSITYRDSTKAVTQNHFAARSEHRMRSRKKEYLFFSSISEKKKCPCNRLQKPRLAIHTTECFFYFPKQAGVSHWVTLFVIWDDDHYFRIQHSGALQHRSGLTCKCLEIQIIKVEVLRPEGPVNSTHLRSSGLVKLKTKRELHIVYLRYRYMPPVSLMLTIQWEIPQAHWLTISIYVRVLSPL